MPAQSARGMLIAITSVVLVFAGFGTLMWTFGLFDFTGTEASAKIVAAALALVGGLIGAVVSILGVLLKYSLDSRNADLNSQAERRLTIEAERNADLRVESEKRLNLEAAIQAVGLLSTSEGQSVPLSQRAGALFSLAGLGHYELATVLTGHLLETDQIDGNSAAWIINRTITCAEPAIKSEAVGILYLNADKLLLPGGKAAFPYSILNWDTTLPDDVRDIGGIALGLLIASRPPAEWKRGHMITLFNALVSGWSTEPNERIKNEIGAILRRAIACFADDVRWIDAKVRSDVASLTARTLLGKEVQVKFDELERSLSKSDEKRDNPSGPNNRFNADR